MIKHKDIAFLTELLRVYVDNEHKPSLSVSDEEWNDIFEISKKQAIIGVVFEAIKRLPAEQQPPKELKLKWFYLSERIRQRNAELNEGINVLLEVLDSHQLKGCILKGQGVGLLYPIPESRQPGDIDVWCSGGREYVLDRLGCYRLEHIVVHHADIKLIRDIPIEVHYIPLWLYNPLTNHRLKRIIQEEENRQFDNVTDRGYAVPTIRFNLVYSLLHIYRHFLEEGVGIRQLMDYYFLLMNSSDDDRDYALDCLRKLGKKGFASALMYVQRVLFDIPESHMITGVDEKYGSLLLESVIEGGNFGQHSNYIYKSKWAVGKQIKKIRKRQYKYLLFAFDEIVCMPFWKTWHWVWRRRHGYL